MAVKVYKRTDASRDIPYQDGLLSPIVPLNAPVFFDAQRSELVRSTRRAERDEIYCASLALFADDENDLVEFLKAIKARGHKIICVEESLTWSGGKPIGILKAQWLAARKAGTSMRGSIKSAITRKAETAAKLAQIEDDLKRDDHSTRELLDRIGIKSINTIKNHYGITREQMQGRYQAAQKRKERRDAKTINQ